MYYFKKYYIVLKIFKRQSFQSELNKAKTPLDKLQVMFTKLPLNSTRNQKNNILIYRLFNKETVE